MFWVGSEKISNPDEHNFTTPEHFSNARKNEKILRHTPGSDDAVSQKSSVKLMSAYQQEWHVGNHLRRQGHQSVKLIIPKIMS